MELEVNRVGEKYMTNEGYVIEIIEYFNHKNCTIKFEDSSIIKNRRFGNIQRGQIRNSFHKSVFGVGYFGVGKYNRKSYFKIYEAWKSMLGRCYDEKYQEKFPTYIECIVCEDWYNFQNFAKWYEKNYNPESMKSWHLDKDILIKGNKIYSPGTCSFVPNEINSLFIKRASKRGKYPIGVTKRRSRFFACMNTVSKKNYIGYFDTIEEAFQAYKTAKEKHIQEVAEKWRGQITEKTYQALINYKVEITD
jgi:hypothetical protein